MIKTKYCFIAAATFSGFMQFDENDLREIGFDLVSAYNILGYRGNNSNRKLSLLY